MKWLKKIALFLLLVLLLAYCAVWIARMAGCNPSADTMARIEITRGRIACLEASLSIYNTKQKRMPETLDELTCGSEEFPALLRKENLVDSWGHALVYTKKGANAYEIRSAGPDGRLGTRDDIAQEILPVSLE